MTSHRLWPSTSGPSSPVSYTGNFIAGTAFKVTQPTFFEGYWWWCCNSGQSTAAPKCALWAVTSGFAGTYIPSSAVTAATSLTPGSWNYIPLPAPILLMPGVPYVAEVAVNGNFPDTGSYWGSGSSITSGPLVAYSGQGTGATAPPYSNGQGVFSTGGTDPQTTFAASISGTDNFWVDVSVSDAPPSGFTGPFRLWNNHSIPTFVDPSLGIDDSVNYDIATEVNFTQKVNLLKLWFYSPAGTVQLPTSVRIYKDSTQAVVLDNASPSWVGAAGSGWIYVTYPDGTELPADLYQSTVYNGALVPDGWSAKFLHYFDTGAGASGLAIGPMSTPNVAGAS